MTRQIPSSRDTTRKVFLCLSAKRTVTTTGAAAAAAAAVILFLQKLDYGKREQPVCGCVLYGVVLQDAGNTRGEVDAAPGSRLNVKGMVLTAGPQELWPTGVVLAFLGTFSGALGDVLVRKAFRRAQTRQNEKTTWVLHASSNNNEHRGRSAGHSAVQQSQLGSIRRFTAARGEEAPAAADTGKSIRFDWCWIMGMLMTAAVDPVLTTLALLCAPSSMVTPFAGAHILWACLLAVLLLRERMHALDVLGAGMVVIGIVVLLMHASKAGDVQTVEDFIAALEEPEAAISACILMFLILVSILFAYMKHDSAAAVWWRRHVSPAGIELCGVDFRRLGVCAASGFLGGFTNTATKLLAIEITKLCESPQRSLQDWRLYFSLSLSLAFALPQLYFLYTALRHYGAVFVVPTVNACIIVSGSVAAFWILQERPRCMPICALGLATVILGVALLSRPASSSGCCSRQDNSVGEDCSGITGVKTEGSHSFAALETTCSANDDLHASICDSHDVTAAAFSPTASPALNPRADTLGSLKKQSGFAVPSDKV
ncbi:hypothetical protein Emag_002438 [Eimeria magna]